MDRPGAVAVRLGVVYERSSAGVCGGGVGNPVAAGLHHPLDRVVLVSVAGLVTDMSVGRGPGRGSPGPQGSPGPGCGLEFD